ncbi:MAG: class I SAM-dependent methyltransferase [Ignavibacteria bacterium]|jgi:ubiquinone/menaquinone biosynthesis C-methylase UbiE|nr:class I SAM-dependent methyltransferase [Ignavibacteria bacterium]
MNNTKIKQSAEFDKLADNYTDLRNEGAGFFVKYADTFSSYKVKHFSNIIQNRTEQNRTEQNRTEQNRTEQNRTEQNNINILEFGCGIGLNVPYFKNFFPNAKIHGCDISSESIQLAQQQYPDCKFDVVNTTAELQIYAQQIDAIFINGVFHHIPFDEHKSWLEALHSIMKPGSQIVIFENNPHNPLMKDYFKNCPLDINATMVQPDYLRKLVKSIWNNAKRTYTFFTPWQDSAFWFALEKCINFWLPLGAQYYVRARK